MKAEKVEFLMRQVGRGRGQGLMVGALAFMVFSVMFAGLLIVDPLGYVQQRTVQTTECELNPFFYTVPTGWQVLDGDVICRNNSYVQVYLQPFALSMYIWAAVTTFVVVMMLLWWRSTVQYEKQLARDIMIYGDDQVFPKFGTCERRDKKED